MRTEDRIHQHTDFLDSIYPAFPIFERRQMIKIILIPSMNIIKFFFRFFIESKSSKKLLALSKNGHLRAITVKANEKISGINQKEDHLEDKIEVALKQTENKKLSLSYDIFKIQRKIIQSILFVEGDNVLLDDEIGRMISYFKIALNEEPQKKQ